LKQFVTEIQDMQGEGAMCLKALMRAVTSILRLLISAQLC